MDFKTMSVVFGTVFLAELGDKTQLATLIFATKQSVNLVSVFVGASLALVLATTLAVAGGAIISQYIDPRYLSFAAGAGFIRSRDSAIGSPAGQLAAWQIGDRTSQPLDPNSTTFKTPALSGFRL